MNQLLMSQKRAVVKILTILHVFGQNFDNIARVLVKFLTVILTDEIQPKLLLKPFTEIIFARSCD